MQEHQRVCFFFIPFGGLKRSKKIFKGYVSFTHWGYHIFQCKVCLLFFFFIEELELNLLLANLKGFYTSVSLRFCYTASSFPAKWYLRNQHRNSILMMCHYPLKQTFNQSEALPRSEFWHVICIGFLHCFLRVILLGTSSCVVKCWMFSQATP